MQLTFPIPLLLCCLQDATELVAKLRAFHHTAQSSPDKRNLGQCGLDLINGEVVNNVEAGVLEPALSKTKMIQVRLMFCLP
jgi:T-complex protein 1 subunit alpha